MVWFHAPTRGLRALTLGLRTQTKGLCTLPLGLRAPINLSLGTRTMIISLTTVTSQTTMTISHHLLLFHLLHLEVRMQPMDDPSMTVCVKTSAILYRLSLTLGNDLVVIMKLSVRPTTLRLPWWMKGNGPGCAYVVYIFILFYFFNLNVPFESQDRTSMDQRSTLGHQYVTIQLSLYFMVLIDCHSLSHKPIARAPSMARAVPNKNTARLPSRSSAAPYTDRSPSCQHGRRVAAEVEYEFDSY